MSEYVYKVGDPVRIINVAEGDEALVGSEGHVSELGSFFPLTVTLDAPVTLDGETFDELYLYEDEVELV